MNSLGNSVAAPPLASCSQIFLPPGLEATRWVWIPSLLVEAAVSIFWREIDASWIGGACLTVARAGVAVA